MTRLHRVSYSQRVHIRRTEIRKLYLHDHNGTSYIHFMTHKREGTSLQNQDAQNKVFETCLLVEVLQEKSRVSSLSAHQREHKKKHVRQAAHHLFHLLRCTQFSRNANSNSGTATIQFDPRALKTNNLSTQLGNKKNMSRVQK